MAWGYASSLHQVPAGLRSKHCSTSPISAFLCSKQEGETPVVGQAEERDGCPSRRSWAGNGANGRDLCRAKLRSWVSQWKLSRVGEKQQPPSAAPPSHGKGVTLGTAANFPPAGWDESPVQSRLSGRIAAPGNGLMGRDMQTDGCKKLCFKSARSRQQCCLLSCCVHLCVRTDGKRIPEIA